MAKWADYGISKVQYNADHDRIVKVLVHVDNGDTIAPGREWSRQDVVTAIDQRASTFVTIIKASDGKWSKGADVHTVTVNAVKYIRTDANRIAADNLENLPEF